MSIRVDAASQVIQLPWRDQIATECFRYASYLTDPVCSARESYWRAEVVFELGREDYSVQNFARKFFLWARMLAWGALAFATTLPGALLRFLGSLIQSEPFLSECTGEGKTLPEDGTFTMLSWNVCATAAGFSITDGGVLPWEDRIDEIVEKIAEKDADVNCLYETFDTHSAFALAKKLKPQGYAYFYYNIGPRVIGVNSGIFVASKYEISQPEFTPYPDETLVGRTKYATKGLFAFNLKSGEREFARIHATHLQHSEIPGNPEPDEVAGRKVQMEIVMEKVRQVRDKAVIVTGDLNMEDQEFSSYFWRELFVKNDHFDGQKTWGGDRFCAELMEKEVSSELDLDHTLLAEGTAESIYTTLVETGYNDSEFRADALSDHAGLYSEITL